MADIHHLALIYRHLSTSAVANHVWSWDRVYLRIPTSNPGPSHCGLQEAEDGENCSLELQLQKRKLGIILEA